MRPRGPHTPYAQKPPLEDSADGLGVHERAKGAGNDHKAAEVGEVGGEEGGLRPQVVDEGPTRARDRAGEGDDERGTGRLVDAHRDPVDDSAFTLASRGAKAAREGEGVGDRLDYGGGRKVRVAHDPRGDKAAQPELFVELFPQLRFEVEQPGRTDPREAGGSKEGRGRPPGNVLADGESRFSGGPE